MESGTYCLKWLNSVVCISILAAFLFILCDARFTVHMWKQPEYSKLQKGSISEFINKLKFTNNVLSNADPYTPNSPVYLPPYDSLSPLPHPNRSPPISQYPSPSPPLSPPMSYGLITPPTPAAGAIPPEHGVSVSPPSIFPSPPQHQPSPPKQSPKHVPGQPIYQPPLSPPHKGSTKSGVWCVAKPTVPDSIIQAAMDYACGSGADCKSVQPNQPCFQPNTMIAHASYAFNSYWQNTKGTGGTCDFGGTAMLVNVDPSFDKCQFNYN